MKHPYLRPKFLPPKLPIPVTLIGWLYIDRYQIQGVWLGVIFTFVGILWLGSIIDVCVGEPAEPKWKGPLDTL